MVAVSKKEKKKYAPEVLNTYKYRGFKISEVFNKKTKRREFKVRFQINNKEFYLTDERRKNLEEMIDEIRVQENRARHKLEVVETPGPTLKQVLDKILSKIEDRHRHSFCDRVFNDFLALLEPGVKAKQLKKSHYQTYLDWRRPQLGKQSKKPIKIDTIYKELWAISGAVGDGELYWDKLENWKKPSLPKKPEGKKSKQDKRRTKIVSPEEELYVLLAALRQPRTGRQTEYTELHRRRLADDLEFRYETGLRRKEVARIELKQYFPKDEALRNVERFKTNTSTRFYPLSRRAMKIIENRKEFMNGSKFIFTKDGLPVESDYRTLKTICAALNIPYGRYTEDGFVPHDLRHNFGSDINRHADIETARELLGHSNIGQTGTYLHTNEARLRAAVRRREGIDLTNEIVVIYKAVRRGKMKLKSFIERVKKLTEF